MDNAHNGHSVTGTDKTKGVYAPLAVADAKWDREMSNKEHARYGCYDSGQGCGSGTHQLSISGNMVQSTETTPGTFTGYQVKDWNLNMNSTSSGANGNFLLNANNNGANAGTGTGTQTLLAEGTNQLITNFTGGEAEYHTITLPESFKFFGNDFTHLHINEFGFVSLDTDSTKPYNNASMWNLADGSNRGAYPLSYFDEARHFEYGGGTANDKLDGTYIPYQWGRPGTTYEGAFDNSIFALLGGYNTKNYNGANNFSIRTLWNSATKIFTVGWYNLRSGKSTNNNAEVNLEIQFNMNDDSFKIVHGKFGNNFPDRLNNTHSTLHNYFTGVSKDLGCLTTTEDISACEGKDYIQLMYFDPYNGTKDIDQWDPVATFQNPDGINVPNQIDSMYNNYFTTPNTARNGTTYCYVGAGGSSSLSSPCSSTYNSTTARLDVNGRMYSFTPQGNSGSTKNVLLPSDIKQAYSLGTEAEFMWMELRKPSTTLTYTPPENNATGFTQGGANVNDSVTGGTLNAGSAVTRQTYANEVIIAGEVYKDEKMDAFLNGTKKVLAFAPIPIIHTNKYRMTQQPTGATDVRFKHAHTIMPHFISEAFMEDKDNGTDLRFDFHQLVDEDYVESGAHMIYGTNGSNSFATQNPFANSMSETNLDGMYAYTGDVLAQDGTLSTTRFNNGNANAYHTPEGQSLWQQVFNPNGRGAGIFVQMNWSCGDAGRVRCNEAYYAKDAGPHKTQQSLFSVLIAEVGSKTFFQDASSSNGAGNRHFYDGYGQGHVMRGEHYWSYKRRSGRTTTTDGAYATTDASPQLSFGLNPIACHSGTDNGCFFGDGQSPDSSTIGAPQVAVVSTADSCIHGLIPGNGCAGNDHNPGVMHSMAESTNPTDPEWRTGSFNQGIVLQKQRDANNNLVEAINLEGANNSWRAGQTTTSDTWSGKMIGLLMTDVNDSTKNAIPRSFNVNNLTVTFDDRNDRVKFVGTDIDIEKDFGNECVTNSLINCTAIIRVLTIGITH